MRYYYIFVFILCASFIDAQVNIEGFVYESGNRGFISEAKVSISNLDKSKIFAQAITDATGLYRLALPVEGEYLISIERLPFIDFSEVIHVQPSNSTTYLKHEIKRKPGYIFEITLAEKNIDPNAPRGGLYGTLVEVYNNTTKTEELVIADLQAPEFKVNFIKGNHYTILVRKNGFLSKRMEAFVDVEGCILCFEGLGEITPGVADNLTESNSMGVLLANVEMDRYFEGKVIGLKDIYYETDKSNITRKAALELNKIDGFLKDNPELSVELGAHTDSRGKATYNLGLSNRRANAAVKYLTEKRGVGENRIIAQGYGESKLTNKCSDSVNCTDLEHAVNRRTELKVLRVSGNSIHRSLRQMKADELLDEILQEISEEGEIRVPEDGTVEEVLAEKRGAIKQTSKSNSKKETRNFPLEVAEDLMDDSAQTTSLQTTSSTNEPTIQTTLESAELNDPTRYSENYTGYKIVLHFSRFELSQEHPLFEKFSKLDVYTTADGNKLYMIESHESRKAAESRLKKRFLSSFPSAYVIGFENGVITD